MNYYIIAGHNKMDLGAVEGSYVEGELTIELRDLVVEELAKKTSDIKTDDDFKSLREIVRWISTYSRNDDIILDIHFNDSDDKKSSGTEAYIPDNHNAQEAQLADALSSGISEILGIKNRGVKTESESQHTSLAMMRPLGINVLVEICFLSNENDMNSYIKNKDLVAKLIAKEVYCG